MKCNFLDVVMYNRLNGEINDNKQRKTKCSEGSFHGYFQDELSKMTLNDNDADATCSVFIY